jgi:hypothetical protein
MLFEQMDREIVTAGAMWVRNKKMGPKWRPSSGQDKQEVTEKDK